MQYRTGAGGDRLSALAFGCMRFARKMGAIDKEAACAQVARAIELGVNYFDTAYIYPGNEEAVGYAFEKLGCREKVYLATKLPHYLMNSLEAAKACFKKQLERLKTDYIDYYLIHMLTDADAFARLREIGVIDWLEQQRAEGRIRHLGFSFHGNFQAFQKIVDAYDWEFCMIQYNYLDENNQAGRRGLHYAAEKGLPVMIMEPLRGGRLAGDLPKKAREVFAQAEPKRSPVEWALRWLWNQPQITTVLSGMNSIEMIEENVRVASEAGVDELTQEDLAMIERARAAINSSMKVGCTGCGYCMPCPAGVDIPGAFRCYNEWAGESKFYGLKEYFMCTALRSNQSMASLCKDCGRCELHCPQNIAIRDELKNVVKNLESPLFRLVSWGASKVVKF